MATPRPRLRQLHAHRARVCSTRQRSSPQPKRRCEGRPAVKDSVGRSGAKGGVAAPEEGEGVWGGWGRGRAAWRCHMCAVRYTTLLLLLLFKSKSSKVKLSNFQSNLLALERARARARAAHVHVPRGARAGYYPELPLPVAGRPWRHAACHGAVADLHLLAPWASLNIMASVKIYPPHDSEYPGYRRLPPLMQTSTQSSTPHTSTIGYLLLSFNADCGGRGGTLEP